MCSRPNSVVPILLVVVVWLQQASAQADSLPLKIEQPQPRHIAQRTGMAPAAGYAHVMVRGEAPAALENATWEYRVTETKSGKTASWSSLTIQTEGTRFEGAARVAAGGWYRLEVRCRKGDEIVATGAVEPIGVGEVFLVAGQSYATNCNDERFKVGDSEGRVVALDTAKGTWALANDPQPTPDGSDGGSIWPLLGDALVKEFKVPVGFANVAVGGTSSQQWMPEGELHPRLLRAGKSLGNFRAVLWQQGESDVIAKTTTEQYVANVTAIRQAAARAWECNPPWLLAKSTHHPTVYNDPDGEGRIRSAVDQLVKQPGFRAGPDTDTLQGENRHFSAVGQRRAAQMWLTAITREVLTSHSPLHVGLAEVDITPPSGFPMAGYYHERLAEGTIDPLKAKAIVFRDGQTQSALVVCDLIGIATDLSKAIRQRASEKTGIPSANIVIAATHSHTAPDYMKELYLKLGGEPQDGSRAAYIDKLISGPVEAIVKAQAAATPAVLETGSAVQHTPVSFNRRFVMRDGSVRTWMTLDHPDVIRPAGPIDPEIGLLAIRDPSGEPRGVLSNFALHLDTVGGSKWSADYPSFVAQSLRKNLGKEVISIFGTGCCGDINHVNPRQRERNKADFIGNSLADSIQRQLGSLQSLDQTNLVVKSRTVDLPLQDATKEEVDRSTQVLAAAARKEKVDFFEQVLAYKKVMLDQMRHHEPHANAPEFITWGLSRSLKGIGDKLPADVTVMTIGEEFAVVCLPGEVFVELGMAIKQGSPFRTTLVIELSNCVETIYIPTRAAHAGGSYEVTNSALQPGTGELLVETALSLLKEAATRAR